MGDELLRQRLEHLALAIGDVWGELAFTMCEIGAAPHEKNENEFLELLQVFPGSKVAAFELDTALCGELNRTAPAGIHYYPVALGRTEEQRILFETNHPMCSSLYRPNTELLTRFNELHVALPKVAHTVQTVSLDHFCTQHQIGAMDFIKIDIQGAELDVFKGGVTTLSNVQVIFSEVEFVPLYTGQPLFGDVSAFLTTRGFMFHKFLGLSGRSMSPLVLNNDPCLPTQHLWANALFIRDVTRLEKLSDEALLKTAVLAFVYGSPDVSYACFRVVDERNGWALHTKILELFS